MLGGIVAGGALALADYGALWLWLSGWDLRLDALWRLGALLLAAGAALGALGAALDHVATRLPPRLRALPFALAAAPALAALVQAALGTRLLGGLGRPAALALHAGAQLGLVGALALLAHTGGPRRPLPRRLALASLLVALVLLTKLDQRLFPRLYAPFHAALAAAAFLAAAGALVLAAREWPRLARAATPRRAAAAGAVLALLLALDLATLPGSHDVRVALQDPHASTTRSLMHALAPLVRPAPPRAAPIDAGAASARWAEGPALPGAHLVLVTIDALRADHLGAYGDRRELTPAMDALAGRGLLFERAYAPAPHSSHSLAGLMLGVHVQPRLRQGLSLPRTTLTARLNDAGYHTAGFYPDAIFHTDGDALAPLRERELDFVRRERRPFDAPRLTDAVLREADRVAARGEPPTFFWVHYFDVHEPYRADELGDTPALRYASEVARVDRALARLLEGLEARLERPLVIGLSADHGEELRDHGGVYHGSTLYEEQVRVPLLLVAPGLAPRRVTEPVELIDLGPSLLALVGVAPGPRMEGADLRVAAAGGGLPGRARAALEDQRMWVEGDDKLIVDLRRGTLELYDLAADPGERRSRADAEPALAEALHARVRGWLASLERGDPRERVLALARAGDRHAAGALAERVAREGPRPEWVRLLGELGDDAALETLRAQRAEGRAGAELAIARGRLGDRAVRPALERLLRAETPTLRWRAAAALRALGERPPASALLLGARRASSLEERRAFVTALGESEDPRATGALLALLPDLRLRVSVIEALGARGDRRAQPALARLARGTSRQDVRGALDAALPRLQ
ncbi:MAG: hypothetical protein CMN29_14890 [Sandaracinus sp.]|nr:hypothetical protein [Sandaracinus sp.]